ncbi:MAG: pyridoxal 5'-phosphate synthase glutaminase subunit PdxT [Actinomycetes bacterium]
MKIGVLALQGDFREHIAALESLDLDIEATAIRHASEISAVDALILPGGESTTIAKLARSFDLFDLLQKRISSGMPVYGSCAGMILLANRIVDAARGQETFGGIDMTVRRNAFGRQIDSFEMDIDFVGIDGGAVKGVFIRAPWVEEIGPNVEVLATVAQDELLHPVAVRQGQLLATSFHPEISGDNRVHRYFVQQVCQNLLVGK